MENWRLISIFLAMAIMFPLASGQPTSTECTQNSDRPACQGPVFADNQDEYYYDIRDSLILNDGQPDKYSVTALHGTQAGNLTERFSDSVNGNTKTEYYVQNTGKAGTNNFARGEINDVDINYAESVEK
jgi:hypothetical protein